MFGKWFIAFYLLLFPSISFGGEPVEIKPIYATTRSVLAAETKPSDSNHQSANKNQGDIRIVIHNDGEKIVVNAYYTVTANSQLVWDTLTDFDNLSRFISGVRSSKITNRTGNTLRVAQTAEIRLSGVSFDFESIGEVNLVPFKEFTTRMISGNMSKMHETTKITSDGDQTHISYHADIVPNMWILRYIGHTFIEAEVRERLQQIRNEIIRKKIGSRPSKMKGALRTPNI